MGAERPSIPSIDYEEDGEETELNSFKSQSSGTHARPIIRRPYLVRLAGPGLGYAHAISGATVRIGRTAPCEIQIDERGVSRAHACIRRDDRGQLVLEDLGSANGTMVNDAPIEARAVLREGDRIQLGAAVVLKFALFDEVEERYHQQVLASLAPPPPASIPGALPWSPDSWRTKPLAQAITYDDQARLTAVLAKLRRLPPLVTSWEVEELKTLIGDAQDGRRFLLQGGDCAETLDDCESGKITNKLKILIQMSLVLIRSLRRPVIRVGRFAGQYAKPRSRPTEIQNGVELPSYYGDLVNSAEFTAEARRPDPGKLLDGYYHAALTTNFIRALATGGFADLRRPEYFDLSFFERAELPTNLRVDYQRLCLEITHGLEFLQAFGDRSADELMRVTFYTSHEGLNLHYEEAQTRRVPRRDGYYDLTTHLPWIGERTRALDGAHVEFFRGIVNPVAVKIGPNASPEEVVETCAAVNPRNERGKLVLVARIGAKLVAERLPPIIEAVKRAGSRVLWVCDPMHGNIITTQGNVKTRDFEDILAEIETSLDVHDQLGTYMGGVHFELTGDDVTECIGGGLTEADLSRNYGTLCDPRLNYRQAIQMAFSLARRMGQLKPPPSTAPPPAR